jgi:polyhydroxyalkanoate synthase subunit PhaC
VTDAPAAARRGTREDGPADDAAAPLDVLLTDAALGPVRRWLPGRAGVRLAARLATRPVAVSRRTGSLAAELARVAAGRSTLEPSARDRRFRDPAWTGNPLLHRVLQAYLATGATVEQLLDDADLDWRADQRMRFLADNAVEALAPSNNPLLNPTALKAAVDTGGRNFLTGAANFARDMATPPRIPSMVDPEPFEVGGNLASSPGAVVLRTPVFELIQYAPSTPRVRTVPLLIAPPTINKYYIADLAPGRSMVEHFVASGQQVFVMSWRNPGAEHADWGLDTYVQAVLDALDAVQQVCTVERSILFGPCSGGIISALVLGYLAATGQEDRVGAAVLGVTVLDQARSGFASAALDERLAAAAAAASARKGYLDGRALAEMFAWLRPGDLVWNYWTNNYLLGRRPPAFDVLFWNADTTRLAARLHRDFLTLGLDNSLVTPGGARALGMPVDLSTVKVDSYVIAGVADHICPWQSCYRTTQLLGGDSRFVLSTSGHIAALVNPPTNDKARFQVNTDNPASPQEWLATARTEQGSWWNDFVAWLQERSGPTKAAPRRLGARGLPPLADAPGTYVLAP